MRTFVPIVVLLCLPAFARAESPRQERLMRILRQDCGSCHGLERKGGLGPSLEPEAMKKRTWQEIQAVILHGRPGTAMPPWRSILSESESEWLARYLTGAPLEGSAPAAAADTRRNDR